MIRANQVTSLGELGFTSHRALTSLGENREHFPRETMVSTWNPFVQV